MYSLLECKEAYYDNQAYFFREILDSDCYTLLSWIKSNNALKKISDDCNSSCLFPEKLKSWVNNSIFSIILYEAITRKLTGFCTLSSSENSLLPLTHVELCHLMVEPNRNYFNVASLLCIKAKEKAKQLGFKALCGRVVLDNKFGIVIAKSQNFIECVNNIWTKPGFLWFTYML